MVKFECNRCGKCCVSFGEFIKIERRLTDRDYYCRYGVTNELFLAHIQAEHADVFSNTAHSEINPKGCPFMRKNQDGKGVVCTIYPTRPNICREFQCYRMLIHDREENLCGRVMGRNELKTSDERLAELWKEKVMPLPHINDAVWVDNVITTLAAHGYRGDSVE